MPDWASGKCKFDIAQNDCCALDVRRPSLLILAAPHFHCVRIVLDAAIFRIEVQFPIDFPCDIGELHHRDRNIADGNGGVELLTLADSRNKISEVSIRHGIAAEEICR